MGALNIAGRCFRQKDKPRITLTRRRRFGESNPELIARMMFLIRRWNICHFYGSVEEPGKRDFNYFRIPGEFFRDLRRSLAQISVINALGQNIPPRNT